MILINSKNNLIRVLIADDQPLVRDGIRIILDSQPDIEVVATTDNGQTAVELTRIHHPDLLLMDIQMPGMSGIEALKKIKADQPETIVLMLTTFDPDEYIFNAFENGADGYLLKDISGERLISLVRDAADGNILIPASIAARLIAVIPREQRRYSLKDYDLTQREMEIAALLSRGWRNDNIADTLKISIGTTKNYISTLYSKLQVKNRREAVCLLNSLLNSPDEA